MADHRNDDDRTLPGVGMNRTPETDPEHLLPEHTSAGAPGTIPAASTSSDPDVVRDEIERTRERMSRTIDQLDRALVRKKVEVQEKLDVAAPIRQKPWVYAGGVFAAGLALGLITGGGSKRDDDEDRDHVKIPRALLAGLGLEEARGGRSHHDDDDEDHDVEVEYTGEGSELDWEDRARELMSVVARQEEEIRALRGSSLDSGWDEDEGYLNPTDARLLDDVEALDEGVEEWDEEWNFDDGAVVEGYGESYAGGEPDLYFGSEYEAPEYQVELEEHASRGIGYKKPIAGLLAAGVAGALGMLGRRVLNSRHEGEELLDVEVELEPRGGIAEYVYVDEAGRAARRAARHATYQAGRAPRPAVEYGPEYGGEYAGGYGVEGELGYGEEGVHDGYTGRPDSAYGGEMEVEVELERPVRRSLPPPRRHLPRVSPLAGAVAAGAAAAVSGMVAKLIQHRAERSHEMEVEVELEHPHVRPARTSPPPPRTVQPYVPQSASRAPRATPPSAGSTGELRVEVDLERPGTTPATGSWTPTAHPEQQGIQGSAFGDASTTGNVTGTSRAGRDLEADAETRGATGTTGSTGAGGTGSMASGTGGTGTPSTPPLM